MVQQEPLIDNATLYDQAVAQLRRQVWVGVLVFTLVALISTRLVRYLAGVESTPIAVGIQLVMYSVIIAGLILRNSRHAPRMQVIFLACVHLVVPVVTLLYGGSQGFGDVTLFLCLVISALYGWRRWMYVTFAISSVALIYTLYLEAIGQPLAPFIAETSRFASLKLLIFIGLVSFIIWMGYRFYSQLLQKHQLFAEEQLRLTDELRQSAAQMTELSADLIESRQKIVTAREEERRGLRRDLQDRIGPTLASLSYRAGAARYTIRRQPQKVNHELDALENNIKETLTDVRQFVYALHPPMLDQLGLAGAVQQHIVRLKLPFSADVNVDSVPSEINAAVEIAAFQLVQTVLEQTHAQLTGLMVELAVDGDVLTIEIELDGGISAENLHNHPAMLTVLEGIDEIAGQITFAAPQPSHVKIYATLPL